MSGALIQSLSNPPNPVEQAQRIFDFQARQATADAYQQSIDRQTGAFDQGKFNALMASTPQGAWNIGPTMQQAGQAMIAQGSGQQQQIGARIAQLQGISGYLTPAYQKTLQGQPVTGQEVLDGLQQAQAAGLVTPQMADNMRRQVAAIGGPSGDASNIVRGAYFATGSGMEQLRTQLGNIQYLQTGPTAQPVQTSPAGMGFAGVGPGATIPMGMTPAQAAQPIDIPIGNNQVIHTTLGRAAPLLADNPALRQYVPPELQHLLPPPSVTNSNFGPGGGRYPTPGTTAVPPPPSPTSPVWAQPPPPLPTGGGAGGFGVTTSPAFTEQQKSTAAASTDAANTLEAQIGSAKDQLPLLSDMQTRLGTKGFTPGLGTTVLGSLRQLAIRAGLTPPEPSKGFNAADPQAAQEEFAKDAALLQGAQLKALGRPTDARQELAAETNPGLLLSKYGNQGIISMLKGNQYAIEAEGQAWMQARWAGWDPSRFNEWQNQYFLRADAATGGRFDPRLFWIASMTPEEQRSYVNRVPADQRAQLMRNRNYAAGQGWIAQSPDGSFSVASQ